MEKQRKIRKGDWVEHRDITFQVDYTNYKDPIDQIYGTYNCGSVSFPAHKVKLLSNNTDSIMQKKKKVKLTKWHYHEALDRSAVACMIVDNMLEEHPVIKQTPKLRKKLSIALEKLGELYFEIGSK